MENYESRMSTAVPWEFLLKSIDPEENSHKKTLERVLHDKGSKNAVAEYIGVSFNALKRKLANEGIKIKKGKTCAEKLIENKDKIKTMESKEIAELLHCSMNTVTKQCKKLNLKYNKRLYGKD